MFISEYIEGKASEKFIEIYNPTETEIDLSVYRLDICANGKGWSFGGKYDNSLTLEGTLPPHSTLVFKNEQSTLYEGSATVGKFTNFNGDDAVGLFKDGTLIDIIGNMELVKFGENIILRRKATITAPSAIYNPEEWESIKIAGTAEDVSGLGSHTMN